MTKEITKEMIPPEMQERAGHYALIYTSEYEDRIDVFNSMQFEMDLHYESNDPETAAFIDAAINHAIDDWRNQ